MNRLPLAASRDFAVSAAILPIWEYNVVHDVGLTLTPDNLPLSGLVKGNHKKCPNKFLLRG